MKRMALSGLAIAGLFGSMLMAADAAQKLQPPLPKPKPAELAAPEPGPEAIGVTAPEPSETEPDLAARSLPVIPREKPAQLQKSEPDASLRAAPKPDAAQREEDEKPEPGEEFARCRNELAALGAEFIVPNMPAAAGKCKVPDPVQLRVIASPAGEIGFPGGPILNCIFAKRFTSWVSDIAAPVVKAQTGEALAAITTGPGYECRSRNGDSTGKISEHAFGNAIDIASFNLASREGFAVSNVVKTGNVVTRWLMALRISACGYFTTVLGPGSNAAHAEHYHFDLGLHGKSGNYRICE